MNYPDKYEYKYFQKESLRGLFERPLPCQVSGEMRLCYIKNTQTVFGINSDELVQHMCIVGRSGSGKTATLRIIQLELARLKIPFLAFDLAKYNTRHIKQYIPNLHILRWDKEFYFNPLKPPPGVKLIEWMLTFCEVTCEVWGLFAASKSLLIDTLDYLYKARDTINTNSFPTIHDLNRVLNARRTKTKSRVEIDYVDRIRNKTKTLCKEIKKMLDVEDGTSLEKIINEPVCIELVGINSSELQTWIVSLLMAWIASYKTNQHNCGELNHVIIYDEASSAFSKTRTNNAETFLIRQLRTLRESGEGIILADQSSSSLNDIVKSNVYTHICLSQTSPLDIREIAMMLGLNREQVDLLNKLEQGEAIIKLASRFPFPVLVRFPFVEPCYITDENLDLINQKDEFISYLLNNVKHTKKINEDKKKKACSRKIDDNVRNFLMAVNFHQFKLTLTKIVKQCGFSAGTGSRIVKFCEKQDLIKIVQLMSLRGRPKFPVLTKEGYKVLGIEEKKFYGKGAGLEHVLIQNLIAEHFKKYKPAIELNVKDKFIDVGIQIEGFLIAFEVAMTSVHERVNIEKDFKVGADYVTVVCKDKKVQKQVLENIRNLPEEIINKTKVCLVAEVLKCDAGEFVEQLVTGIG